ncbi:MAG: hypothetical protein ACOX2O_08095 [Bdellovibrionota bacterium]|jgi:hypothetical protein
MIYVHGALKGEDLLSIGYTIGNGPYAKGYSVEEIDLSKLEENFSELAEDRGLISAIAYLHNKLKLKD